MVDGFQNGRIFKPLFFAVCTAAVTVGLYITSVYDYLLFHTVSEIFSIAVAFAIFLIVWNSRNFVKDNYTSFIGIAFLYIGSLDLMHTLSYKGIGIFKGDEANITAQLWIASRYLHAASFLIAPILIKRKLNYGIANFGFLLAVTLFLLSIFYWKIFPDCFIEGAGLTSFKKISENVICGMFLLSILFLFKYRQHFERSIFFLIISSLLFSIGSELSFIFYTNPFGFSNLVGHFFKIISFYLIYKAFVKNQLTDPYSTLFRHLKQNEITLDKANENLKNEREQLELRVKSRTAQLEHTIDRLEKEISERLHTEKRLISNQDKLRALSSELMVVEENERRRIAIMLHDSIGQSLAFTKKEIGNILKKAPEGIRTQLEYIKSLVQETVKETRDLTVELSSMTLYTLGLGHAIEELAEQFSDKYKFNLSFSGIDECDEIDQKIQIFLFRSAEELLGNVAKHANAANVSIDIKRINSDIMISVEDDGVGFSADGFYEKKEQSGGFGLFGLRERLANFNGDLEIRSKPGQGTAVLITVPIRLQEKMEI